MTTVDKKTYNKIIQHLDKPPKGTPKLRQVLDEIEKEQSTSKLTETEKRIIESFKQKLYTSESKGGFTIDYAGCDDPCCGGCAEKLNEDIMKDFLQHSMELVAVEIIEKAKDIVLDNCTEFSKTYKELSELSPKTEKGKS